MDNENNYIIDNINSDNIHKFNKLNSSITNIIYNNNNDK